MSYDQAYPQSYSAPATGDASKNGLAIGSLVVGIFSLCIAAIPCCGGLISVVAIVLGFLGMKSSKRTLAIIGLVLGGLGILINIIASVVYGINLEGIMNYFS